MDTLFKSGGLFLCRTPFPVGIWVGETLRTAALPLFFYRVLDKRREKGYNRHERKIYRSFFSCGETVSSAPPSLWVKVLSTRREAGICPDGYPTIQHYCAT